MQFSVLSSRFSVLSWIKNESRSLAALEMTLALPPESIQTVAARSLRRDEEKHEAVGHRQLAFVHDGPEAGRGVHHEVGGRHLARGDKRRHPGKQSHRNQNAAGKLDDPAH